MSDDRLTIICGDALIELRKLPTESVQCCVTSPPYWGLRDYGIIGQLGLEKTPDEYVAKMVEIFREVRRVLRADGTLWLNLGDSYASSWPAPNTRRNIIDNPMSGGKRGPHRPERMGNGLKEKDLVGIPWMTAFALRSDGWYLRSDIIWSKANCMPESVLDRPTRSHEYVFLLAKNSRYFYDAEAIKEPASEADWESRIGRANLNNKLLPTEELNDIRPRVKYTLNSKQRTDSEGGPFLKNAEDYAGKNAKTPVHKNSKQRGHGRRHDGFNDRWDAKEEACLHHGQNYRRDEEGTFSNNKTDRPQNGMRNKRDVWTVAPANYPEAHFATFPGDLIKPCILAGSRPGDMILDPFAGSGTTGMVALELGRKAILIELNPQYCELIRQRCDVTPGLALA